MDKGQKTGDLLVQAGMIDPMQLRSALGHQKRWGGKIGKVLVDLGFIEEDAMVRFLAERLQMQAVNLLRFRISPQAFEAVPENLAKKYQVVPVLLKEVGGKKIIVLAMNDPSDLHAIDQIQFLTGAKVEPVLATDSAIARVLANYGHFNPEAKEYSLQEDLSPARIKQESASRARAESDKAAAPAPEPTPPPEDVIDLTSEDDLELIQGEVTMLKAAKPAKKPAPGQPAPSRASTRFPTPTQTAQAEPASPSPFDDQPKPETAPPAAETPETAPIEDSSPGAAPEEVAPADGPASNLPEIAALPEERPRLDDSDVLLQSSPKEEPSAIEPPPLPSDFIDEAAAAAGFGAEGDRGLDLPEASEEVELTKAYEFIPTKPLPLEEPPPSRPASAEEEPPAPEPPAAPDSFFSPPAAANEVRVEVPPLFEEPEAPSSLDLGPPPLPGGLDDRPAPTLPSPPSAAPAPPPVDEIWGEPPTPEPAVEKMEPPADDFDSLWEAEPADAEHRLPDLPPMPDLEGTAPRAPSPPAAPDLDLPPDWDEHLGAAPASAPAIEISEMMVEEIDGLEAEAVKPPASRPEAESVTFLPFELPPPGIEEIPLLEPEPAESAPADDLFDGEPIGLEEFPAPVVPAEEFPALPDEQVMEVAPDRAEFAEAMPRLESLADAPPPAPPAAPLPAGIPELLGEMKLLRAAVDDSPAVETTRDEISRLDDLGEEFLDTGEVKRKLALVSELEREAREREFQFDDLLSLMMKKELGEITQELFMKELRVLKKRRDENRKP
jgi:type IV pilus assembly protein PilB